MSSCSKFSWVASLTHDSPINVASCWIISALTRGLDAAAADTMDSSTASAQSSSASAAGLSSVAELSSSRSTSFALSMASSGVSFVTDVSTVSDGLASSAGVNCVHCRIHQLQFNNASDYGLTAYIGLSGNKLSNWWVIGLTNEQTNG